MAATSPSDTPNLCIVLMTLALVVSTPPLSSSLSTLSISETSERVVVCGLNLQSRLRCLSFPVRSDPIRENLNLTFAGVVAGDDFVCALRSFAARNISVVVCWSFSAYGRQYRRIYQGPEVEELRDGAGGSHICGILKRTRQLRCWRWSGFRTYPKHQNISSIAVGDDFVCWLSLKTRSINCIGGNRDLGSDNLLANGSFSVVAAGSRHACAITSENHLKCWGATEGVEPRGKFVALALGESRSCALRFHKRTVVCWGKNRFSLPKRLKDVYFSAIEAKRSTFCGVATANYTVYCWGNEKFNSDYVYWEQKVLPGPCQARCSYGPVARSGGYCGRGYEICEPGPSEDGNHPNIAPVPPEGPTIKCKSRTWTRKTVACLVIGCIGSLSMLLVIAFTLFKHFQSRGCRRVHNSGPLDATNPEAQHGNAPPGPVLEKKLSQLASIGTGGQLEEFSLQDLLEATDGFSQQFKIGSGSFGSVYRALMPNGRVVAVKRAEKSKAFPSYACQGVIQRQNEDKDNAFIHELESLSRLNHKNLVRLLGFCEEQGELVLVYEYVDNGTLHDHLHKLQTPLPWATRIKIALDAAKGVEYLHEHANPSVIHRDIKSSNILLDATWVAKVSDFGLSLIGPEDDESHLSLCAAGTLGYIDPEYYRLQQLTTKSDVYSFGVVLLEILTGRKAIHKNEDESPRNVVDYALPYIRGDEIHRVLDKKAPPPTPYEIEAVCWVGNLAADCVAPEGRYRPSMTHIVDRLKRALATCLAPSFRSLSLSTTHSA